MADNTPSNPAGSVGSGYAIRLIFTGCSLVLRFGDCLRSLYGDSLRLSTGGVVATKRPLRADAARNRRLLLGAAHEAFARDGVSASLDEVARAAGVGPGTLYRHFPTRDELRNSPIPTTSRS